MSQRLRHPFAIAWFLSALAGSSLGTVGCTGELDPGPTVATSTDEAVTPAPPTLHRLTAAQHRATLEALFPGYALPNPDDLPGDTALHGFSTVGASELTIDAVAAEKHEAAALALAAQTIASPERRSAFYGCDVAGEETCIRRFVERFGRLAWRRPLEPPEIDAMVELHRALLRTLRDPWRAASFVTAAFLQSPHFLFRVEVGEPDPTDPRRLRYTSLEMASRLSYFLWGGPPDDALLTIAARGGLVSAEGVRAEAERMLEDPRARAQMIRFFSEFFALERLERADKNSALFPEWGPGLRASMRAEVEEIVGDVWDRDLDVRQLFSTDVTFVDSALASLYGLPDPGDGRRIRATLPPSARRGGILGRGAILATYAHATISSPVRRGKFVVTNVLCVDVPPPPPGVPELPHDDGSPRTQRMRLARHVEDPSCGGCHRIIDPPGLALEHFDAIGRYRTTENTLPIDARVEIRGVEIDGAAELGAYLASSPQVGACITRRAFRFGLGHLETEGELPALRILERQARLAGYRMRDIVLAIVTSDAFRHASIPAGASTCTPGETRACSNTCGSGVETCIGGAFRGCTAPSGGSETCNGLDDDCDGATDEGLSRECSNACGSGVEMCVSGSWTGCTARAPASETCNRFDDDCDGSTDEGFAANVVNGTYSSLRSHHGGCDGGAGRIGEACNAAIDGYCRTASGTCGTSGFGPVENSGDVAVFTCVGAIRVETSYDELASIHSGCNGTSQRVGPDCNAAIHRLCARRGMTTGYGPVQTSGRAATVACLPGAEVVSTTYSALSGHHGDCTAATRHGSACNAAIHRFCVSRGATSGFGPLENSGNDLAVACVRP